jgi:hypothetical protein
MDARTYLDTHGETGLQALAAAVTAAGGKVTLGYLKQIAYGYRKPGSDLAILMVEQDPQRQLDLMSLLKPPKREPAAPAEGEGDHAAP